MAKQMITLRIKRGKPGDKPFMQSFSVPLEENSTVLTALIWIRENLDPTLAFRYSCRSKRCGLCAVQIDGKPGLSCMARFKHNSVIEPLANLPVVRDLVVDREKIFARLEDYRLFIPEGSPAGNEFVFIDSDKRKNLLLCLECLGCLATCPEYRDQEEFFGGPFLFVKLAQLHYDPRDTADRRGQASMSGIDRCRECGRCYCINGVSIYRNAIKPLLGI